MSWSKKKKDILSSLIFSYKLATSFVNNTPISFNEKKKEKNTWQKAIDFPVLCLHNVTKSINCPQF